MNKIAILGLFVVAFSQNLLAQDGKTLRECIDYALKNNTEIRVAELQIKDAEWQIKENRATGFPTITADLNYNRFLQAPSLPAEALGFQAPPGTKIQFVQDNEITGKIQASQLIFSNSYLTAMKAARFYRDFVASQAESKRRDIRIAVTQAYLPSLLLSENLTVLDNNISNLEKLLVETKAIQTAGFAEQLDVDRLDLSLSSLRDERTNIERQYEMVVNGLKFSMQYPMEDALVLEDDLEELLTLGGEPDLTTPVNFNDRSDYRNLIKGRDLNALQTELYNKTWMPTVAAFGSLQGSYQGNNSLFWVPSSIVGLNISVPIYDFGGTKAKRERTLIATQQIDVQRELLENAIKLEVENSRKQYISAKTRVENQKKNLVLSERIYDTTTKKYKAGVGSSFEMITAEQGVYAAQQSLMNARYDLLKARAAIESALR